MLRSIYLLLSLLVFSIEAKTFIIGVQDVAYYPLYDFPNESHAKELLDTFAKSKNYKFIYLALPIKRTNYWYKENAIDFKYPDSKRWSRGRSVYPDLKFSDPIVSLMAGANVRKDKLGKSRVDIKTLGTILGFHATMWLDLISKGNTQVVESSSPLNIIKQVVYGYVDATNIEPSVINYYLSLLGKEGELVLDKTLPHEIYTFQLSTIKYENILDEFNQFLKENHEFLESLEKKYHLTNVAEYSNITLSTKDSFVYDKNVKN
ncbi:hypothetical protein ACOYR1_14270 [Thalassotalea piscium]